MTERMQRLTFSIWSLQHCRSVLLPVVHANNMLIPLSLSLFKATSHPAVSSASKYCEVLCLLFGLGLLPQPRISIKTCKRITSCSWGRSLGVTN